MKKNKLTVVVGLMVILAAAAVGARQPGPGPERAPGPKGAFVQDLSEEQRTAMREIMEKHREAIEPLRTELDAKSAELHELVKAEAGELAIFAKIDEIGALRTEMMKKRMEMQLELRAQLTDEQKQQFDEKTGKRGRGPGRGSGGRGPGGPGPGGGFE
jgi:Spy/CpxP family protein refolding chaperone